jgi:hypothetical protein
MFSLGLAWLKKLWPRFFPRWARRHNGTYEQVGNETWDEGGVALLDPRHGQRELSQLAEIHQGATEEMSKEPRKTSGESAGPSNQ